MIVLYAVLERRGNAFRLGAKADGQPMVYRAIATARMAVKLRGRGDAEAIRVIPVASEGTDLAEAWEEYEHTEVQW